MSRFKKAVTRIEKQDGIVLHNEPYKFSYSEGVELCSTLCHNVKKVVGRHTFTVNVCSITCLKCPYHASTCNAEAVVKCSYPNKVKESDLVYEPFNEA